MRIHFFRLNISTHARELFVSNDMIMLTRLKDVIDNDEAEKSTFETAEK